MLKHLPVTLKKNMSHPNFIIGLVSIVGFLWGVILRANSMAAGDIVLAASALLGGIHWIWSITDVVRNPELRGREDRVFWLTLVIVVPPIMGMVYYMMRRKRVSM